jgi:hypothetical protein
MIANGPAVDGVKVITPTVRVMGQALFICTGTRKLSRYATLFF